jgi:hypothetical protein
MGCVPVVGRDEICPVALSEEVRLRIEEDELDLDDWMKLSVVPARRPSRSSHSCAARTVGRER